MLKVSQLLLKLFLVRAALDQNVLEAAIGKCTKEFWSGNFVQKLFEDHSSTTCDDGHAARLTSDRRHLRTQRHPDSPEKLSGSVPDRKGPIPELDDEAEGDREDLSRVEADDVVAEGADEVNELREGGDVLREWNSLIKDTTESDDPDDGLAEDQEQKNQDLKSLRCESVSSEEDRSVCLCIGEGGGGFGFALKAQRIF